MHLFADCMNLVLYFLGDQIKCLDCIPVVSLVSRLYICSSLIPRQYTCRLLDSQTVYLQSPKFLDWIPVVSMVAKLYTYQPSWFLHCIPVVPMVPRLYPCSSLISRQYTCRLLDSQTVYLKTKSWKLSHQRHLFMRRTIPVVSLVPKLHNCSLLCY